MEETKEIIVGMADFKIGKADEALTTILGSCIGVCLYSPSRKAGGLLHLMMPSAGSQATSLDCKKAKYADTGIPELIRSLKVSYGIPSSELTAKIFGGAKVLKDIEKNIGNENIEATRIILKEYGIPIKATKTGGEKGYRLKFFLNTGVVSCQVFGKEIEEY